jgi:DNA-binding response OmpR family regulator
MIMLTAEARAEDIAKGLARGADGYVTKPYSANTLDYILRYVMKQEIDSWSTGSTKASGAALKRVC